MMLLWAQIPGADEAIKAASREGWVAVLLVILVIAIVVTFGYVLRTVMKEAREREKELKEENHQLQTFVNDKMMAAFEQHSVVMEKVLAAAQAMSDAANEMTDAIAHCRLQAGVHAPNEA